MRLRQTTRLGAVSAISLVALLAGCSDRGPTSPHDDSLARLLIVSAPSTEPSLESNAISATAPNESRSVDERTATVVYVSLPPNSAPSASRARVRNRRTGDSIVIAMVNGGFDPAPISARVGDELTVELIDDGSVLAATTASVPPRRPPRIVRVDPPNGKTDVPLNARIVVVFSEPMDPATIDTAIQLSHNGQTVDGVLSLSMMNLEVVLAPVADLMPSTQYTLIITTAVRDLADDALEQETHLEFTTAAGLVTPPTLAQCLPTTTAQPLGMFTSVGRMAAPRGGVSSILLPDGRVVVYGSTASSTVGPRAEVYDPTTQTFAGVGEMVRMVGAYPAVVLPDGKLLFLNSVVLQDGRVFLPAPSGAVVYDPSSGTYTPMGSYAHASVSGWSTQTLLLDGRVLLTGAVGTWGGNSSGAAELFDPKTGTFKETGPMKAYADTPGWGTLLTDGTVLFVQWNWDAEDDDVELYDPSTETFRVIGKLCGDNNLSTAVRLEDGTVLITGGQLVGGRGTTGTLLYLPERRTFVAGPQLSIGRFMHSATLLLDGRVLVAGGYGVGLRPVAAAEVYTPPIPH